MESEMLKIKEDDTLKGWVSLSRYCKVSGETRQAVHMRVRMGKWKRGVHYACPDGGSAWVNLPAVEAWLLQDMDQPADHPPLPMPALVDAAPEPVAPAVPKDMPKTFTTFLAELIQEDEKATTTYANSTGMDMPIQGRTGSVLGPLTREAKHALQFNTLEECAEWCEKNSNMAHMFIPMQVELPYAN